MNVMLLTPGIFDKGGIARYNRFQIKALRGAFGESSVRVLSLLGDTEDGFDDPPTVAWMGDARVTNRSRALFARAAISMATRVRPDAIVSCHVNLGPLAAITSALSRSRVVQNIYGMEIWSGLSIPRRLALAGAALVLSDCENTAREAVRLGLVGSMPEVVWDCVELRRYTPGPPDASVLERYGVADSGRFRMLFLGRINADTRYKGTERALHVLSKLPPSFELVFGGKGDDCDHLRRLGDSLGLGSRVRFTGAIEECDLPDVYRSADVLYLTSETGRFMGEGIPLTPIEAMACGVPIVVGNRDGSRELVEGGGGFCADPFDLAAHARYIDRLATDSRYFEQERVLARRRAESAFSYETFSVKTVHAIERAVKGQKQRGERKEGAITPT